MTRHIVGCRGVERTRVWSVGCCGADVCRRWAVLLCQINDCPRCVRTTAQKRGNEPTERSLWNPKISSMVAPILITWNIRARQPFNAVCGGARKRTRAHACGGGVWWQARVDAEIYPLNHALFRAYEFHSFHFIHCFFFFLCILCDGFFLHISAIVLLCLSLVSICGALCCWRLPAHKWLHWINIVRAEVSVTSVGTSCASSIFGWMREIAKAKSIIVLASINCSSFTCFVLLCGCSDCSDCSLVCCALFFSSWFDRRNFQRHGQQSKSYCVFLIFFCVPLTLILKQPSLIYCATPSSLVVRCLFCYLFNVFFFTISCRFPALRFRVCNFYFMLFNSLSRMRHSSANASHHFGFFSISFAAMPARVRSALHS